MTMKMSFCLKAATTLSDQDVGQLTDAIEAYVKAGMSTELAELAAVNDLLAEANADRTELVASLRTQHAPLFAADRPALAKPAQDLGGMFDELMAEQAPAKPKGIAGQWGDAAPAARRKLLAEAGYTDGDQARVLSGTDWNQLTDSVRRALDKAPARTATQSAASAALNTGRALGNAIDGLGALFGGKGTLGSGPVFDEETYAKAKPLFAAALANLKDAAADLREAMRTVIQMVVSKFGAEAAQNMKPYVVRFIEDVRDGKAAVEQPTSGSAPSNEAPKADIVEHVTGKGKTLRGVVRTDLSRDQAKEIDAYTFKKDGGYFIREKHIDALNEAHPADAPAAPAPQTTPVPRNLRDDLYAAIKAGNMPKGNLELKKLLTEFDGEQPSPARMKEGQEALETAIVMTARDTIDKKQSTQATFDMLVRLYESQPLLNVRTSTSVANQAYSTPAPLAYVASKLAGITRSSVTHEPTAGNGMLLIGADPALSLVNELNQDRAAALRAQGFEVTTQDATTAPLVTPHSADAVVTNPPFGGIDPKVKVDGYVLGQIDHLIAARALEAMKDDGRAVLLLGANKMPGGMSNNDLVFFNWLRAHYNVTAQFEVDGGLYERQGAGWPVRVVVINGRGPSADRNPNAYVQRASDWKGVYEQYEQALGAERSQLDPERAQPGSAAANPAAVSQPAPATPAGNDRRGSEGRAPGDGNVAGERAGTVGDRGTDAGAPVGGLAGAERSAAVPAAEPVDRPAGGTGRDKPAPSTRAVGLTDAENQFQAKYLPRSSKQDKGVLIPVNMAGPTQDALNRLEDEVGNIDEFTRTELGYETVEDLHDAFMGLQVDSVAMAIHQVKAGKGIIIADQTGIGKGRQAAAMIRWALRTGKTPVFISVKPSLFTDMYGDLADIGSDDVDPFILNLDASIKGAGDEKLFANKGSVQHRRALEGIASSGELPAGRNALFMTYSQINIENVQRRAVTALAPRALFIMDESHNAGGDSNTGDFIKGALELSGGSVYLSATYAKRPDNMPVYFKTDIGEATADDQALKSAMANGGLPLQTVVSNNLVQAGQMFRRERSYDGVSIESRIDTKHRKEHERLSDAATSALRAIVEADAHFHDNYFTELQEQLAAAGERVLDIAGNQAQESVGHTEFSSVVHNFVRQMLLGLKAQAAAEEAIASFARGEKPLIALENTMGSFLAEYADANNLKTGDKLGKFDYRNVLSRALTRSRFIVRQLPTGDKVREEVTLAQLGPDTRAKYQAAQALIDDLKIDIPVSPIDWMRHLITQAGFSVKEITGRDLTVDYTDPKAPTLDRMNEQELKDKVHTTREFNGGQLEAIILNVAGSTGISLHASEKFTDQRVRHMIVVQAAQDINIFMQMLGRIHRTGQVALPKYTLLSADLPAEKRPTALLSGKMKSLNANTSSNTESATSVKAVDMLNQYGDEVIGQYLSDNMELSRSLGIPEPMEGERPMEDIARKATGRMALMPVVQQEAFYSDVEEQYAALIEYLNKTNQNELEPRTFDFDAKELKQAVLFEGQNKASPFGQDAIYGEYSVKAQGKPMTPDEIRTLVNEHLAGAKPAEHAAALRDKLDSAYPAYAGRLNEVDRAVADASRTVATQFIQQHAIGSTWRVEINGDVYNAVITNLRSTHKQTGNPFALSKLQVTVAVNGSLRSVTTAATKFRQIEVTSLGGNAHSNAITGLFESQPKDQRETAKIVTGNLLGAYGELKVKGTIISFTKQDGSIEQGILLPKKFAFERDVPQDYRLQTAADALKFLQESENGDVGRFGIMSRDTLVRAMPHSRGVTIQVPKSKAKGGRFFLDPAITKELGDFVSTGNVMKASTSDPAEAERALAAVMKKVALYALPSMAEEARQITGNAAPSADFSGEQIPTAEAIEDGPVGVAATKALQAVQAYMNAKAPRYKDLVLTPLPAVRQPNAGDSALKQARFAAQELARTMGLKLVYFSSNQPNFANGIAPHTNRNIIFVNEASANPVMAVMGHELLHAMRGQNPELYDRLLERLGGLLKDPGAYADQLNDRYAARGIAQLSEQKALEELVADIVGDNFTDPQFWRAVAREQPSLFQRVLDAVRDFLNSVLAKLKNERPYGTDKYLTDVQAARDAVVATIKEFAETKGAMTQQEAELAFSDNADPFYSELAHQVRTAPMKAGSEQAWRDYLKGLVNKGAVKADEIAWTGIEDWLSLQRTKVSRQEVLDYLMANGVRVTETTLGGESSNGLPAGWTVMRDDEGTFWVVDEIGNRKVDGDTEEEAIENARDESERTNTPGTTKYSQYQLPGGTNYREVLLTLPSQVQAVATRKDATNADFAAAMAREYQSGHWDQPNVLAHIRLNDRTDADGKRVLFVEEIQSDWAQQGKKSGFSKPADLQRKATSATRIDGDYWEVLDQRGRFITNVMGYDMRDPSDMRAAINEGQRRLYESEGQTAPDKRVPAAPFVNKTDAWVALAIKRVIKMAADEGYDRVAFVNGEQSAERYDLSKQIKRIEYHEALAQGIPGTLEAFGHDGDRVISKTATPDELPDVIGKEVAKRLMEQPTDNGGMRKLSGLDLKVGGEGMKAFYDKIVPSVAKDVVRKLGGGPLKESSVLGPDGESIDEPLETDEERAAAPRQLGFDITPAMREKAAGGMPMFSLNKYTDEQAEALGRAGIDTRSRLQRAGDKIRVGYTRATQAWASKWGRQFQQGYLDQFTGIQQAIRQELGGLPTDQDPYVAARLANGGTSSVMRGLLLHGQAKWAANGQHLEKIDGTKGLLDILAPLGNDLNDFFGWMIGNRAARLMKEGRENNFTPEQIKTLQDLAIGKEAEFRAAALQYSAFKRSVLDIAEEAGLIKGESRKVWDQADYIPFYREIDEKAVFGVTGKKGLSGQSSGIRTLKGGTAALNDPMENILMNFSRLIDASLKNNALRKTVQVLEDAGSDMVKKVGYTMSKELIPADQVRKQLEAAGTPDVVLDIIPPEAFKGMAAMWAIQPPSDPDVVRIMVDGKPQFYKVSDPLLLKAVTSFIPFDFPGLGLARAFKRVLTATVTATPEFIIRNFIRDSMAVQLIAKEGFHPGKSLAGMVKAYNESGAAEAMLFAGASFQSGQINGNDPTGTGKAMRRALRRKGLRGASANRIAATVLDTPARFWEAYRHVGEAVENANREAVYEATLKKRGATAAAFESKDIMDFTLRGSSPVYQLLADVVPFLNARVQGMYRLGRADPKRLAFYGTLMLLASFALAAANADNDEYDQLQDWDKDTYWHFWIKGKHFRVPKPFELGLIFATLPERIFRYAKGQDAGKKFIDRMFSNVRDQLAIDLLPWRWQIFKPAHEVAFNHDSFRDRSIESLRDEKKLPSERYGGNTSATAVAAVQAANFKIPGSDDRAMDALHMSPKKLEHLVGGYLGTAGLYALGLLDSITRKVQNAPPQPSKRLDDYPVVKSFYRQEPARGTVFESDLYAMRAEVDKIYNSVRAHKEDDQPDKADQLRADGEGKLDVRKRINKATARLSKLNRQRDEIYAARDMTPDAKRKALDEIQTEKNEVAREIMKDPDVIAAQ